MHIKLMHRESEVLEFELGPDGASHVMALERADLAPLGVFDVVEPDATGSPRALYHHLLRRAIPGVRPGIGEILSATGASNPVELAVRSGGFSLSDCFWYRREGGQATWAGSNFFENGWDPTFGEAMLARDYARLARADTHVPDVTCGGATRKGWVCEDGSPRLLKASLNGTRADVVGEMVASRMLARILRGDEYVSYELEERGGELLSSCAPMVGPGEDLLDAQLVTPLEDYGFEGEGMLSRPKWQRAYESVLRRLDVPGRGRALAQMAVTAALLLRVDIHARNYGVVRNADTGALRAAPLYDLEGAFGTGGNPFFSKAVENPRLAETLAGAFLNRLEPEWDYSWYDPCALEGFGDELEGLLGRHAGWPASWCETARLLFESQIAFVNDAVGKAKR